MHLMDWELDQLKDFVSEAIGVPAEELVDTTNLREKLPDSLTLVEMIVKTEREFNIDFAMDFNPTTFGELRREVERLANA